MRPAFVRVLLVSDDFKIIDDLCNWSQPISIRVETCCEAESAMRRLCQQKFEGVIVDLSTGGGPDLLKKIRTLPSNKTALSFAILQRQYADKERFFSPANFVLQRPLQSFVVSRVLKAAYPMLVREKRRYFRYPVQISVVVRRGSDTEFILPSLNLSEGGICLHSSVPLKVGDQLRLRLRLPSESDVLEVSGTVCWSESLGRVGIQFTGLTEHLKRALQTWIAVRLEETLSASQLLMSSF